MMRTCVRVDFLRVTLGAAATHPRRAGRSRCSEPGRRTADCAAPDRCGDHAAPTRTRVLCPGGAATVGTARNGAGATAAPSRVCLAILVELEGDPAMSPGERLISLVQGARHPDRNGLPAACGRSKRQEY